MTNRNLLDEDQYFFYDDDAELKQTTVQTGQTIQQNKSQTGGNFQTGQIGQTTTTYTTTNQTGQQGGQIGTKTTNTTTTKGGNNVYEFYEDIEDMGTGEDYEADDTPTKYGLLGGGLALVSGLVLVGLMGTIYHRDRTSITLSHMIMACIGVCVAGLAAGIFLMTKGAMSKRTEPNHLLIGVALLLCLAMFAYFLASSLYIFMYRPFHYCELIKTNNNSTDWNDTFGNNWLFEDGWGEDRRILWWAAFFTILACVGFLIAAICLWLLSRYSVQTAKMCLGAACFAGLLLGLFAIEYLWTARDYFARYSFQNNEENLFTALLALIIVGCVLLFINAILNIFRKRAGHFIFGILLIIWVFITVCVLGLLLRDMRQRHFNNIKNSSTCPSLLDSLHQDDIKSSCDSKYLDQTCTKQFLVSRWETDKQPAFLNPGCCCSVQNWLLWPLYITGCLTLLMIAATLIAIGYNFYLSDKSEYLEFEDKKIGLGEIIFAVCCVLALIAFGFWWGFADRPTMPRTNENNPDVVLSKFTQGSSGYTDDNFQVVDLNKVYGGNIPVETFIPGTRTLRVVHEQTATFTSDKIEMHTGNQILNLKLDDTKCPANKADCGMRIAILSTNGKLLEAPSSVKGTDEARTLFFNDTNVKNDFVLVKGTVDDLNKYLASLKVYPADIAYSTIVYFKVEQLDLKTLNSLGLKDTETTTQTNLTSSGTKFVGTNGWTLKGYDTARDCYGDNSCVSDLVCNDANTLSCQKGFVFHSSDGEIDIVVPLKVYDTAGNPADYTESTLRSSSNYDYDGNNISFNQVALANSKLTMKVPKPIRSDLVVNMNLYDTANRYLPVSQSYVIPAKASNPYVTDDLFLITKSGQGCVGAPDVNACFANQKLIFTGIETLVKSQEDGKVLEGKNIKLYSGLNGGRYVGSEVTNKDGYASFANSAYDYYVAKFEGDSIYLPASQQFALQSEKIGDVTLFLNRRDSTVAVLEQEVTNGGDFDKDFGLSILSATSGKECVADPLSKWCAYAQHINDVQQSKMGYEKIKLDKFTVSHYLGFVKEAPAYSATCPAADPKKYQYYPNSETSMRSLEQIDFNWDGVRKLAAGDYQTLYCFTGWGLNSKKTFRVTGNGATPSAKLCTPLYPATSKFNVDKLKQLNAA